MIWKMQTALTMATTMSSLVGPVALLQAVELSIVYHFLTLEVLMMILLIIRLACVFSWPLFPEYLAVCKTPPAGSGIEDLVAVVVLVAVAVEPPPPPLQLVVRAGCNCCRCRCPNCRRCRRYPNCCRDPNPNYFDPDLDFLSANFAAVDNSKLNHTPLDQMEMLRLPLATDCVCELASDEEFFFCAQYSVLGPFGSTPRASQIYRTRT
jgi:hypothetical protein